MKNLAPSLFFLFGYVDGVVDAKAAPTVTTIQLIVFTVLFFVAWDGIEWLEK